MHADTPGDTAAEKIDGRIAELDGWRGEALSRARDLIKKADPDVVEEWKWNVPVWSHSGIICTGESYKSHIKLTFPKGSQLPDPSGVLNAGQGVRRAIDLHEGDDLDEAAFMDVIRAAVALNESKRR